MVFGYSRSYAKLRLPPRNSPDQCLYSRRSFCFYHPDFITQTDFTDPPKLEGGCATNLYVVGVAGGREMRRRRFTTPTLSPA